MRTCLLSFLLHPQCSAFFPTKGDTLGFEISTTQPVQLLMLQSKNRACHPRSGLGLCIIFSDLSQKNLTGVNFFIQIDFKPSTSTTFLPCCKIIIIAFFLLPSPIQHHLWFKVKALLNELFSINAFHFQWLLFFWSDQSLLYGLKLQQTMWLVTSPTQPNTQRFPLSNFFGVSSPSIKTHCSHNKAIATIEHCFIRDHHFSDTRCENCHLQLGTDGSSATLISFSYKRRSTTKVELNQNDSTVRIKQRIHWVQRWLCVWLQLLLPLLSACSEKEISSLFWKRQVQEKIDFWILVSLYFAAGWSPGSGKKGALGSWLALGGYFCSYPPCFCHSAGNFSRYFHCSYGKGTVVFMYKS